MFREGIILCFVMIFATTVARLELCRFNPVVLPDVCFNPSLTTDCSALSTSGDLLFYNVRGVILNAYDSLGNLVDKSEYLNVSKTDLFFFYSFSGSNVTKLEFTFIWDETANAIGYASINQCFEDESSCSPVFNVQPCHATRIKLDFDARADLTFKDRLEKNLQQDGLKGSSFNQAFDSTPWCFQYTSSFYLKEVSFYSWCGGLSVILEYYNNNSLVVKPFLILNYDQRQGLYTEVNEPIKKFCLRCDNWKLYVSDFVASIVLA